MMHEHGSAACMLCGWVGCGTMGQGCGTMGQGSQGTGLRIMFGETDVRCIENGGEP